jgi:hypothetical protein
MKPNSLGKFRDLVHDINNKFIAEFDIKEWANEAAYKVATRGGFEETNIARERKARFGRLAL